VYRDLTSGNSECLSALASEFGDGIISSDGSLDRARLSKLVFCGEGADARRERLNAITHKFILEETSRRLEEYERKGFAAAIVDAPLLFESGFDKKCDVTLAVLASDEVRIARIINRDGITRETAMRRISSQLSNGELIARADYTVYNDADLEALELAVDDFIKKFL